MASVLTPTSGRTAAVMGAVAAGGTESRGAAGFGGSVRPAGNPGPGRNAAGLRTGRERGLNPRRDDLSRSSDLCLGEQDRPAAEPLQQVAFRHHADAVLARTW